jgi:hypothetical protein
MILNRLMPSDPEEEGFPKIFGTYLDMSRYPEKIHPKMRKILKMDKKPIRFRHYLATQVDTIIMDLFHGNVEKDMTFLVNAINKMTD